jgi:hypothetical protein
MGGFDRDRVRSVLDAPGSVEPLVVLAVGRRGDTAGLPEPLADREAAPRTRLSLDELLVAVDVRSSAAA